ncbi:MAG: hypothetical protein L6Q72_14920, partial [Burkholderiaceae bacterium]|nr:hypothetical protein [Burkholderiaceae bacterium]
AGQRFAVMRGTDADCGRFADDEQSQRFAFADFTRERACRDGQPRRRAANAARLPKQQRAEGECGGEVDQGRVDLRMQEPAPSYREIEGQITTAHTERASVLVPLW